MSPNLIYLDNAATSWPKHPSVGAAMASFLETSAGNPGRGGHALARAAADTVEHARYKLMSMINAPTAARVVLTHGCTDALNLAIHGVVNAALRQGCEKPVRVVTTALEHNAVLRTLHCLEHDGVVDVMIVQPDAMGRTSPESIAAACTECTALVCVTHASNALGTIQPVKSIIEHVRRTSTDALVLVDAAQTLGHIPIDVQDWGIDLLAVAGHKGLGGPTGTGALYISERAYADACTQDTARLFCMRRGGTGSVAPGLEMPTNLPDALEAGTSNAVGFAGLVAAMDTLSDDAHAHEMALTERLLEGLGSIPGVEIYGRPEIGGRTPVVLFNVRDQHPRDVATRLDKEFGIAVRGGVHCAPLAHSSIGTGTDGGVRVSPGRMTMHDEIRAFIDATASIASDPAVHAGA